MPYTGSKSQAGRSTQLQRGAGSPTVVYTTIDEVRSIGPSGGKADLDDVTNMDSGVWHEKLPTLLDAGEFAVECNLITTSASQANVTADFVGQVKSPWQIVLPDGSIYAFSAYVTEPLLPKVEPNKAVTCTFKLTISGPYTYTAI
jgi:predicted secreted protein